MSKILDWIKKHVWQTILIGFGLFFIPLILVHVAYRIPAISPWLASSWNSGELLTYIAGFEAFIGTVFLGITSVNLNENLLNHEKLKSLFERKPEINVSAGCFGFFSQQQLLDLKTPIFYEITRPNKKMAVKKQDSTFCLFCITLFPQKNSDLYITKFENILRFVPIDQSRFHDGLVYEKLPQPIHSFTPHIQMSDYSILFVLDNRIVFQNKNFNGILSLTLRNTISDYYIHNIMYELDFIYDGKKSR